MTQTKDVRPDDLKADWKTDELLAERYMKWENDCGGWYWTGPNRTSVGGLDASKEEVEKIRTGELKDWDREWIPDFSTDRLAALRLLDHWQGQYNVERKPSWWSRKLRKYKVSLSEPAGTYIGVADTLELAICRAAYASTLENQSETS